MSGWDSQFFWSSWRHYNAEAEKTRGRRRMHENRAKPCEKCAEARERYGIGNYCDYWTKLWDREEDHRRSAASARYRARELELEEGKPQAYDGVKLQSDHDRELREARRP